MSSGDLITIYQKPTLTSRFPGRWHPNTDTLASKARTEFLARWPWALESDKEFFPKRDNDSWFLAVCPEGPDDRVLIGLRWTVWLFLCDDAIEKERPEDAKRMFITIKNILSRDSDREVVSPVAIILEDLCNALISVGDSVDLQNLGYMFLSATTDFFKACASKEARKAALRSGFEEYIKVRFDEAAGWLTLKLLFWARGIIPPFGPTMNPKLYRLMEISVVQSILVNDLFSYRIEIRNFHLEEAKMRANAGDDSMHGFTVFNWTAALIQFQGMSYEEAGDEIRRMISVEEEKYLALLEELRTEYTTAGDDVGLAMLEQISQVLIDLMAGNADWSALCGRYNYGFVDS